MLGALDGTVELLNILATFKRALPDLLKCATTSPGHGPPARHDAQFVRARNGIAARLSELSIEYANFFRYVGASDLDGVGKGIGSLSRGFFRNTEAIIAMHSELVGSCTAVGFIESALYVSGGLSQALTTLTTSGSAPSSFSCRFRVFKIIPLLAQHFPRCSNSGRTQPSRSPP